MTSKRVFLAATIMLAISSPSARAEFDTLGNFQPFAQGSYHAYPGMWSLYADNTMGLGRAAVENVDFESNIHVNTKDFPQGSTIQWRVPGFLAPKTGVYGYLQLAFGNYAGSMVPTSVTPRQVNDIDRLEVMLGYSYSGDQTFNVLNELFLLADPDDQSSQLFEVGLLAHVTSDTVWYFDRADQVGVFTDSADRLWRVAIDWTAPAAPYVMLMPQDEQDVMGKFDWLQILDYLRSRNIISGDEWFTGIAAGVEPLGGAGRLELKAFDVTYEPGVVSTTQI